MKWRLRVNTHHKIKGLPLLFFALFQSVLGPTACTSPATSFPLHPAAGKLPSRENIGRGGGGEGRTRSDVVAASLATHLVIGSVIVFFLPRCSSGTEAAAAAGA